MRPSEAGIGDLFRRKLLFWVLVPCLVALDLWSKSWAFDYVDLHGGHRSPKMVVVVPGFFNLVQVENTGTIFGIAQSWTTALVVLRLVALVVLLFFVRGTPARARAQILALALIFAGAVGNLYDNLFSPARAVRDFLQFHVVVGDFPAFNVADSCITVGAVMLLFTMLRTGPEAAPGAAATVAAKSEGEAPGG